MKKSLPAIEFPHGVDFCFTPLPEKRDPNEPPRTRIDRLFRNVPLDERSRAWARTRVAQADALLYAAGLVLDGGRRRADITMELGLCHFVLGDLEKGRALSEDAAALWEQLGDERMLAETLMRAGFFHQRARDLPAAVAYYERAAARQAPGSALGPVGRYNVLMAVWELHMYREDWAGAADAARRALAVARAEQQAQMIEECQMALTGCYVKLEQWRPALEAAQAVLVESVARGNREMEENIRFMIADFHRELGEHRESAEAYEVLLKQARQARAPRTLMIELLMKTGQAWRLAGDASRAGVLWRELLPLADAETSRPLAPVVRANLATLALEGGEAQRALDLIDQALPRAPEALRPGLLLTRAEAHLSLGQADKALADFRDALALARRTGDAAQEAALLARMSVLLPREEGAAPN